MSAGSTATRRGRPLDPAVDAAILQATLEVLGEHGYARLRVGDVAQRAHAGLGALYRRWPTKRDLVLATLRTAAPDSEIPVTDDPRADVLAGLSAMNGALAGPKGRMLAGMLAELPADPELAAAIRETVISPLRDAHRDRLRRLIGDVPDLHLRADLGPSLILSRALVFGEPLDRRELADIVLPLIASPGTNLTR